VDSQAIFASEFWFFVGWVVFLVFGFSRGCFFGWLVLFGLSFRVWWLSYVVFFGWFFLGGLWVFGGVGVVFFF